MRVKKRFSTICIIVLCIFVVLFFVNQGPRRIRLMTPSEKTIKKDVTRYLEKRYDEKFHITNIISLSFEYACYIITAYPYGTQMNREHEITIQGWEEDGLITYYDTYPLMKLIPELKDYISECIKEEFPENKIYVSFYKEWFNSNLPENLTLGEFLTNKKSAWNTSLIWKVCVPNENFDSAIILRKSNNAVKLMADRNISGLGYINIMYKNYESLPIYYFTNMLGENGIDFIDLDYFINKNGKYDEHQEIN